MPLSTGNVQIQCAITGTSVPSGGLNVWAATVPAPLVVADVQAMVARLATFYDAIKTLIPTGTTVTCGSKAIHLGVTPHMPIPVTPSSVSGTGAGDPLPLQTALVLALKGPALSRRQQGRIFLPLALEATNGVGGVPIAGSVNVVQAAATVLLGTPPSAHDFSIYSRVDQNFYTCMQMIARSTWAVLRSRRK